MPRALATDPGEEVPETSETEAPEPAPGSQTPEIDTADDVVTQPPESLEREPVDLTAQGGCSAFGGSPASALGFALLGFALLRRRRT